MARGRRSYSDGRKFPRRCADADVSGVTLLGALHNRDGTLSKVDTRNLKLKLQNSLVFLFILFIFFGVFYLP